MKMNRWSKRIGALAVISVLAFTGCGGDEPVAPEGEEVVPEGEEVVPEDGKEEVAEMDIATLIEMAKTNMSTVESWEASVSRDVSVKNGESVMETMVETDIAAFTEPIKMDIDVTNFIAGKESAKIELYAVEGEENIMSYANLGTGWSSQELALTDMEVYDIHFQNTALLKGIEEASIVEETMVDDMKMYEVKGVLNADEMKNFAVKSGFV